MSQVCARAKDRPKSEHVACTGCEDCPCHGVRLQPGQLRARVQARKAERAQAQDDPG